MQRQKTVSQKSTPFAADFLKNSHANFLIKFDLGSWCLLLSRHQPNSCYLKPRASKKAAKMHKNAKILHFYTERINKKCLKKTLFTVRAIKAHPLRDAIARLFKKSTLF